MIKLIRIEILGFKNPSTLASVEFPNGNASIIYGENGIGKTTILQMINAILKHDMSPFSYSDIREIHLLYTVDGTPNEITIKHVKLREEDEDGETFYDDFYDFSELLSSELKDCSVMFIGVDRGTSDSTIDIESIQSILLREPRIRNAFRSPIEVRRFSRMLSRKFQESSADLLSIFNNADTATSDDESNFTVNLSRISIASVEELLVSLHSKENQTFSDIIQEALFEVVAETFGLREDTVEIIDGEFYQLLEQYKDKIINSLPDGAINPLKTDIYNLLRDDELINRMQNDTGREKLKKLLCRIVYKCRDASNLSPLNLIIDKYNELISGGNKRLIFRKGVPVIKTGSTTHDLKALSSGERHLLTFIVTVYLLGTKCDIILIDEPEISLHVRWQRKLIPLLSEIAPTSQIIAASHSPAIVHKQLNHYTQIYTEEV